MTNETYANASVAVNMEIDKDLPMDEGVAIFMAGDDDDDDDEVAQTPATTSHEADDRTAIIQEVSSVVYVNHMQNKVYSNSLDQDIVEFKRKGIAVTEHDALSLRIQSIANHVVTGLNKYGWALVDNFIGRKRMEKIYNEFKCLYQAGLYRNREMIGQPKHTQAKLLWFDDKHRNSAVNTSLLVSLIDAVSSLIGQRIPPHRVSGRSKPLITCYKGDGQYFTKHVDNSNNDGRCITTVYYANQEWKREYGGQLRMYPRDCRTHVDIEPKPDRLIYYWSDARMPHEVLATDMERFAMCLWYFDGNQCERAANLTVPGSNRLDRLDTSSSLMARGQVSSDSHLLQKRSHERMEYTCNDEPENDLCMSKYKLSTQSNDNLDSVRVAARIQQASLFRQHPHLTDSASHSPPSYVCQPTETEIARQQHSKLVPGGDGLDLLLQAIACQQRQLEQQEQQRRANPLLEQYLQGLVREEDISSAPINAHCRIGVSNSSSEASASSQATQMNSSGSTQFVEMMNSQGLQLPTQLSNLRIQSPNDAQQQQMILNLQMQLITQGLLQTQAQYDRQERMDQDNQAALMAALIQSIQNQQTSR